MKQMGKVTNLNCTTQNKLWTKKMDISMILLMMYVFFSYTSQNTLFPPIIHSVVMYTWIGWTVLSMVLSRRKMILTKYTIWYLFLILFCFLSFLWGIEMVTTTLYTMFVTLVITYCFMYTLNSMEKVEICIGAFVVSADAMGLMIIVTGQLTFGIGAERLGETITGNANSFSTLLMVAAIFASWLLLYKAEKWDKVFNMASLVFLLFFMGISGGRKTIISVIVCFVYFAIARDINKTLKTLVNVLKITAVLVALYLAVMKIPVIYETVGERFEQLALILRGGTSSVSSDNLRGQLVWMALQQWTNRPILGHGLDTFKYYNQMVTGHFYYAHNNYAEILYDLGVVGFALYYGFIGNMALRLKRVNNTYRSYKILGLGLILEILLFDLGGISYYTVLTQIILCIGYTVLKNVKCEK